jgi:excisionase family DNA binding protein
MWPPDEPLTLSVAQAARATGLSQHAIRRGVRDGTLPSISIGRLIRILRLPLLRLLGVEDNEVKACSYVADARDEEHVRRPT